MNITDFSGFDLPIIIDDENEYVTRLKEEIKRFKKRIEIIFHDDQYKEKVLKCKQIIDRNTNWIIIAYLNSFLGKKDHSIKMVRKYVDSYKDYIECALNESFALYTYGILNQNFQKEDILYQYKGTIVEPYECVSHKYISHIPLNLRNVVKTNRFSIPGVPCIYLAQNSYISWKELSSPDLTKFTVSAVKVKGGIKILDITNRLIAFDKDKVKPDDIETYFKFMEIWPLTLACSFKIKNNNRNFKTEYVIPQMLMSCLTNDVVGIAYSSNQISHKANVVRTNIAIPILKFSNDCKFGDIVKDGTVEFTDSLNFGYFHEQKFSRTAAMQIVGAEPGALEAIHDNTLKFNWGRMPRLSTFNKSVSGWKPSYDGVCFHTETSFFFFDEFILRTKAFKKIIE